jgi:hypothetical protein
MQKAGKNGHFTTALESFKKRKDATKWKDSRQGRRTAPAAGKASSQSPPPPPDAPQHSSIRVAPRSIGKARHAGLARSGEAGVAAPRGQ